MRLVSSSEPAVLRDRFIRLNEVERLSGVKKSTIYALMKQDPPAFPRCVQVSPRCVAWSEAAVLSWLQRKLSEAKAISGGAA